MTLGARHQRGRDRGIVVAIERLFQNADHATRGVRRHDQPRSDLAFAAIAKFRRRDVFDVKRQEQHSVDQPRKRQSAHEFGVDLIRFRKRNLRAFEFMRHLGLRAARVPLCVFLYVGNPTNTQPKIGNEL